MERRTRTRKQLDPCNSPKRAGCANASLKSNPNQVAILMVANDAALSEQYDRAKDILAQGPSRTIATAYKTVTPKSLLKFDFAKRGWEDKDGESIEVSARDIKEQHDAGSHAPVTDAIAKLACQWLRDHDATRACSSSYCSELSYSTAFEAIDCYSVEERSDEFFLFNFTEDEERLVYDEFARGWRNTSRSSR